VAGRHCAKIPSSAFKTYLWRLAAWFRRAVSETGQTLFPLALITYDAVDLPRKLSACDFMVCIRCTFVGGGLSKKKIKKIKDKSFRGICGSVALPRGQRRSDWKITRPVKLLKV